ncbi:MAG: PilZ domain-containing protein [Treponema sp.]|nr:PilZ domain-containing protein [Treponema sp.]
MQERRKNIRYHTIGRARIPAVFEGDMLLKDLSITGCRIQCAKHLDLQLNTRYAIQIIPESVVKTGSFELLVESRWIHSREDSCEAAFMVVESPKGKQFESYVDYLAWRSESELVTSE